MEPMSRDATHRSLHHDLRGALSAVQMNLQTLESLESGEAGPMTEKRLTVIRRAMVALAEAVELTDRLRAKGQGSVVGPS